MEHKSLYMDYKNQEKKKKKKKILSKHMAIHCVETSGSVIKKKNFLYHDAFPNPITRSGGLGLALSNPASHNSNETLLSPACHFNWNIEVGHGRKSWSILLSWRNLLWWTNIVILLFALYVFIFLTVWISGDEYRLLSACQSREWYVVYNNVWEFT